ncbi:MAG: zf-HC2 domain-containing protein [Acidobacteriia bacterium]|nr:zf-HC2 domain-containing protein [Terriglobia bacterium]
MKCSTVRSWLFRLMDDELPPQEREQLHAHLTGCLSCTREWKLLTLPRRIGRSIPALEPSPFFYARLKARLEREEQAITIWQIILGLSRQIVPAMATVTLVIISLFAYLEFRGPRMDLYQAYDSIFIASDRTSRMVIAEDITDESVLHALAEKPSGPSLSAPKK